MILIYGLICPLENTIRYVGKTSGHLRKRLHRHIRDCRKLKKKYTHKELWLRKLDKLNLLDKLKIDLIEEVSEEDWQDREIYWISEYRKTNDLTNTSDGGDGICLRGEKHPMFGKHRSEETINKIRQSKIGKLNPMFGKTVKHNQQTRKLISINILNSDKFKKYNEKRKSETFLLKIKEKYARPVVIVNLINEILFEYSSCREAAKNLNFTYAHIKNSRRNNTIINFNNLKLKIKYKADYYDYQNKIS